MHPRSIFCIALTRGRADLIINDLREAGLLCTEISVLFLDKTAGPAIASGHDASASGSAPAAESAGAIRGVMAWIADIRRVVIPGVDPLIAAGPVADAFSRATVGGIAGGLVDYGLPQTEANRYEGRINEGHTLISVHGKNPDKCDRAREIFSTAGAEDMCTMMNVSTPRSTPRLPSRRNEHALPRTNIA